MDEAVVLLTHYRNDEVTQHHYDLLRKYNDFPIVPLYCDDGQATQPLDDAVQVPMTFRRGRAWHNLDWICWQWFQDVSRINAKRYIWLDWDCRVDVPLQQWYGDQWSDDFVASRVLQPPEKWYWFRTQRPFLPHVLTPFARGVTPLNGLLLSRHAMMTYAHEQLPEGIFCEFRLATVLASRGIEASQLPREKAATNRFLPQGDSIEVAGPGFHHPVKHLVL